MNDFKAGLAQLVERLSCKEDVVSSNLTFSSIMRLQLNGYNPGLLNLYSKFDSWWAYQSKKKQKELSYKGMKKFRLEGDPHEAEMVECEFGEFVKLSDAEKENERLKNIIECLKEDLNSLQLM